MSDYGTMKTRVASEVMRPAWAATHVANAIQDAILDYEGTRFGWNEGRFLLNTVADQETYTIPTDVLTWQGGALAPGETILEIDGLATRYNNDAYPLTPVTEHWLEVYQSTGTKGQPIYYSRTGNRLRFAPVPEQAYTVHIAGLKKLKTLSADIDTNEWMVEAAPLIRARAKVILFRDVLRNVEQARLSEEAEQRALLALQRQRQGQETGRIQSWGAC